MLFDISRFRGRSDRAFCDKVFTNLDDDDDEDPDRHSESRLEENDFGNFWEGA